MKLIVLPTATAARAFRDRLLDRRGVVLGVPSAPLSRLMDWCAQAAGLAPALGRPTRLEVLSGLTTGFGFEAAVEKNGLAKALLGLVDRLTLAGPDIEATARAVEGLSFSRFGPLGDLFRAYHRRLSRLDGLDSPTRAWQTLAGVKKGLLPEQLRDVRHILVRDIESFTPPQAAVLAALAGQGRRVELRLPFQPPASLFDEAEGPAANRPGFRLLEKLQQGNDDFTVSGDQLVDRRSQGAGGRIIELLTQGPGSALESPAGLEMFRAGGKYNELEAVGRRIRILIDGGADPRTIGLAARNLSGLTGQMIEDVGRRYNIPLNFRRGHPLAKTPPVAVILSLLDLAARGVDRSGLLRLAESAYLVPEADLRDGRAIRAMLNSGLLPGRGRDWRPALATLGRRAFRPGEKEMVDLAFERLQDLEGLIEPLTSPGNLGQGLKLLLDLIDGLHLASGPDLAARDRAGRDDFSRALEGVGQELAALGLADRPCDAAGLAGLVNSILADETAAWTGRSPAGVWVLRAEDVRGLELEHLFITGLAEGDWPSALPSDPLLSDGDKLELNRALGLELFTTREAFRDRERLLLLMVLASAGKSVHLSRYDRDSSGKPKAASPLWAWLETCLGDHAPPEFRESGHWPPLLADVLSPGELTGRLSLELSRADAGAEGLEMAIGAAAELTERGKGWPERLADIQRRADIERRRALFMLSPEAATADRLAAWTHVGRLSPETGLAALLDRLEDGGALNVSLTGLDELAACPFRFLAGQVLDVGPGEAAGPEANGLQFGILIHNLLQRLMEDCLRLNRFPPGPDQVRRLVDEETRIWLERTYLGHPALAGRKIAQAGFMVQRFIDWEADQQAQGWRVLEVEKRFENLILELDGGDNIRLTARADRIDLGTGNRLRVLDYKTGYSKPPYAKMIREAGRSRFQLPVYMTALARTEGHDPERICGGYYLAGLAELLPSGPLSELNETMQAALGRMIPGLRQGRFEAGPLRPDDCERNCGRLELCRYRRAPAGEEE